MRLRNATARAAATLETSAFLALLALVAWGPLAYGSVFGGGRAGLMAIGGLVFGLWLASAGLAGRAIIPNPWWTAAALALAAWTGLSTMLAGYPYGAQQDGALYGSLVLAAIAGHALLRPPARRNAFGLWLLGVAAVVAGYAIAQKLGHGFTPRVSDTQLSSFYPNPSHYTGFVVLALPVALWALFFGGRSGTSRASGANAPSLRSAPLTPALSRQGRGSRALGGRWRARGAPMWGGLIRLTGLAAAIAFGYSLAFTDSSSLPAAMLTAAGVSVLWLWRVWRPLGMLATAALVATIASAGWLIASPGGQERLSEITGRLRLNNTVQGFIEDRAPVWKVGLEAARDAPLTGYGPGGFALVAPRYRPESFEGPGNAAFGFVNYAHQDYYQIAVENGWIGLALYALVLLMTLVRAGRQDALGLAALIGLAGIWLTGLWEGHATVIPGTMAWYWPLMGLVAAGWPDERDARQVNRERGQASSSRTARS